MWNMPLWLSIPLTLAWLIAPAVLLFALCRKSESPAVQLGIPVFVTFLCFLGPWLPDAWLVYHARSTCSSEAPYTIHRIPASPDELPVASLVTEPLDYGLTRGKVEYRSGRTGEMLATTQSWQLDFTPVVTGILGLSPEQQGTLLDQLLPAGCSFDSRRPTPGTDTTTEQRFWRDAFKPANLALPDLPRMGPEANRGIPEALNIAGLPSLSMVLARDPSATLLLRSVMSKVGKPVEGAERESLKAAIHQLLWHMASSDRLDPRSRGAYIDARDLAVLERIDGHHYWGVGGPNPSQPASEVLSQGMTELLDGVLAKLTTKAS